MTPEQREAFDFVVLLNCTALVEGYRHREGWRYNAVRARRAEAG
jgi:hypothetical protein